MNDAFTNADSLSVVSQAPMGTHAPHTHMHTAIKYAHTRTHAHTSEGLDSHAHSNSNTKTPMDRPWPILAQTFQRDRPPGIPKLLSLSWACNRLRAAAQPPGAIVMDLDEFSDLQFTNEPRGADDEDGGDGGDCAGAASSCSRGRRGRGGNRSGGSGRGRAPGRGRGVAAAALLKTCVRCARMRMGNYNFCEMHKRYYDTLEWKLKRAPKATEETKK
eukprot:8002649-Pyramimonas_sp.AAC.1